MTESAGPGGPEGGSSRRADVPASKVVAYCLAILSVATAVIHFAVAGSHFQEYWVFGVFMLVVAWMQLAWAVAVMTRARPAVVWGGALLNAVVIAVYIVTRTVGDVIGPTPHQAEPFGFGDGLCTVLEGLIIAGCVWLLLSSAARRVDRHQLVVAPAATGTVTAILLSVALVAGGPDMVMTASASTGTSASTASAGMHMNMPATDTSVRLATQSPAGEITMPAPNMQMAAGMKMADPTPCVARPTAAQQRAAVSLVNASWQQARKFQSLAVAKAAGYVPLTPTGRAVVHYVNPAYYIAMLLGGPVLNTAKPQSLVYANTPRDAVLAAAMYITSRGGATPQPGGCLTQWHVHTNLCISRGFHVVGVLSAADPTCPAGSRNRITPAMMHIWYVPIPGGPTAIDATDQQIVSAAERVPSPANGRA